MSSFMVILLSLVIVVVVEDADHGVHFQQLVRVKLKYQFINV